MGFQTAFQENDVKNGRAGADNGSYRKRACIYYLKCFSAAVRKEMSRQITMMRIINWKEKCKNLKDPSNAHVNVSGEQKSLMTMGCTQCCVSSRTALQATSTPYSILTTPPPHPSKAFW